MRNLRLISSEDFFFLENTMISGQKLVFVLESHTIFCPTHKVLHVNCTTSFGIPTARPASEVTARHCSMVRPMLNDLVFSSLFMLAITSIKKIGSPQKKVEKHCTNEMKMRKITIIRQQYLHKQKYKVRFT